MIPGFHCSSLDFHDPAELIPRLAELGFGAMAIRPRRGLWNRDLKSMEHRLSEIGCVAKEHSIAIVLDLDAPFWDDVDRRDPFSLASEDEAERDAARHAIAGWIETSALLCPIAITFSTGRVRRTRETDAHLAHEAQGIQHVSDSGREQVLERLVSGIEPLSRLAASAGVRLALRPVGDHAISTVAHFERFGQWLGSGVELGLAADVGEMLLGGEFPIGQRLARLQHRLTCVYLCEPDLDRHCDQRFGRGDIDLGRVWEVMTQSGFVGPGVFRSCGHGRMGLALARDAIALTLEPS